MAVDPYSDIPLQLRRKIEESLLGQQAQRSLSQQGIGARPTEYTPGGLAVKQSPFEHLLRALTSGVHGYNAKQYRKRADEALEEGGQIRSQEMARVMEALAGSPGHTLPPDMAGPQMPPTPGNPQEAISAALQAQTPSVRGFGQDLQKRMMDQRAKVIEQLTKDATPQSTQQFLASNDPRQLQPKPQYQQLGDSLGVTNPNQPGFTPLTENRFDQTTQNIAGIPVPAQVDTYSGKVTPAATASITTSPAGRSKERISEFDLKLIDKGREPAQKLAQSLGVVESLANEIQKAYTSGSLAEYRLALGKFASLIGGVPDPKDINAEYVQSLLQKLSIGDAKALGVNPTDRDLQIIQQSVGSINTDPQALPRLLETVYRLNATALARYNGLVQRAESVEQRLDPEADYSRYLIASPENPQSDPQGLLRGLMANPGAPRIGEEPKQPGRRRIDLTR